MKIEMEDVLFVTETSVTIRGSRRRTTVPKQLAERMELKDGSRIRWILMSDGTVILVPVRETVTDP